METPESELEEFLESATEGGRLKREENAGLKVYSRPGASLEIEGWFIGQEGWARLAQQLSQATELESVSVIGGGACIRLAALLPKLPRLTSLSVRRDQFGDNGVGALGQALQNRSKLTTLALKNIELANKGAQEVAQSLSGLRRLASLDLSRNAFGDGGVVAIAGALTQLKQLTFLDISGARFQESGAGALADAFLSMKGLANLRVGMPDGKALRMLADGLRMLKGLTSLALGGSPLALATFNVQDSKSLPWAEQAAARSSGYKALASALLEMTGLATLSLDCLPPRTGGNTCFFLGEVDLKALSGALRHLTFLRLTNSGLRDSEVVKEFGQAIATATKLTFLDLSHNDIEDKEVKAIGGALAQLSELTSLNLDENMIGDGGIRAIVKGLFQRDHLEVLHLRNNQIKTLPTELGSLPALRSLEVQSPSLRFPPREVVDRGTAAIVSFLRQAEREKTKSRAMVKLLFVGPQRVGKSSLFRALKSKAAVPEGTKTTVGVDVMFWEWELEEGRKGFPITFRVFDCAGQKQYGAMQRLFLTAEHCIYVLVFNINDEKAELNDLKERLDSIQAVAPGSIFVLVGTHSDKVEKDDVAQQRLADMHGQLKAALAEDLKGVAQHAEIDLDFYIRQPPELWEKPFLVSSTEYKGVRELEETLVDLVEGDTDSFVRALPLSWVRLFDEVAGIQEDLRSQAVQAADMEAPVQTGALLEVHVNTLWQRVEALDIGFENAEEFKGALWYMSALGFVLQFSGAPGLTDIVFLQPSWLAHVLGDLFSHTLLENESLADDGDVEDLVERGLLRESLIPKLPKLRAKGGSINTARRLLDIVQLLELGYQIPGGGERECYLPARWQQERPDMADMWSPTEGDQVRGWRLTSSGRLPAGFFETALVQSGICVAHPPQLQWKGGAFIKLDGGVSLLVENRGSSGGGARFDILAKFEAFQASADLNKRLWKLLSPVIISTFLLHKVVFHGDRRIEYATACPAHPPDNFLKLTPSVLNEIVKGRYEDGELKVPCNAQRDGHVSIPWADIAPDPNKMRDAFCQEEVLAALRRIEQTQRGFPLLIEQAEHALGKLMVETRTNAFPRAFAVQRETLDKRGALLSMKAIIEEAAKAALAVKVEESSMEVRARKFLAVVYNRLMLGLFQDHAKLYLLCEECDVPQGDGYKVRRKSIWGGRLASALGVLLVLGKLSRLAAPMVGAEELADGLVKAIGFAKAPLDKADSALPGQVAGALSASQSLRHVSKNGFEAFELGRFLQEHDKDGAWKGLLFLRGALARPQVTPDLPSTSGGRATEMGQNDWATVWICQLCLAKRTSAGPAPSVPQPVQVSVPAPEPHRGQSPNAAPEAPQAVQGSVPPLEPPHPADKSDPPAAPPPNKSGWRGCFGFCGKPQT